MTLSVGQPFDMQLNSYWVEEWGLTDGSDPPGWFNFVNKTIDTGIKFKLEPSEDDAGQEFEVYYTLQDDNRRDPKSATFKFDVMVISFGQDDIALSRQVIVFSEAPEIIKTTVEPPDAFGNLGISFSRPIKLPISCSMWNSGNEGAKRIAIDLLKSEATGTVEYDQDVDLSMSWRVSVVQ